MTSLVVVQLGVRGLVMKLCPECVLGFSCEVSAEGISVSEKEMIATEFSRNFRLVILQPIEIEWGGQIKQYPSVDEFVRVDQSSQTALVSTHNGISDFMRSGESEESTDTNDFFEAESCEKICGEENVPKDGSLEHNFEDINPERPISQSSLFTAESYNLNEALEESPFHDRFSSRLIGRTLVVGLVKVIEATELKVPLKKGYCVLELDEPYQRHISHLISLADYPVWNQHFIFSLNSNSQRISIELFQTSKKCQSPISLGISLIPISFIIVGQTENCFPINCNHFGSKTSWRCDNVVGATDSKIPAFVIDFKIMKTIEDTHKTFADESSERSSNSGALVSNELAGKYLDSSDGNIEAGIKMKTIRPIQTSSNKNSQIISDQTVSRHPRQVSEAESHQSASVIRRLRNRFSQFSVPWTSGKSKSDDCLDKISDDDIVKLNTNEIVPVQPAAVLFVGGSKSKFSNKRPEIELNHSRGLSTSLKKMLSFQAKKPWKNDQYKDKSLDHLFKEIDSKLFDTISKEGFDRIMDGNGHNH